ncbi:F-box protein [Pigmentibacter ruber]|uniref:F-box protein n=1 Tax=Pigmentibacter ruber TaxID=2683196 RepID=UPI00131B4CF6|nr:F-box protein [Pigmentibacter ruber]
MKHFFKIIFLLLIYINDAYATRNNENLENISQTLKENIYSNLDTNSLINLSQTSTSFHESISEYIEYSKKLSTIKINGTKNEIFEYLILLNNNLTEKLTKTNNLIIDYFDSYDDLRFYDNRALGILLLAINTFPNLNKFTMIFHDSTNNNIFESISIETKGNEIYLVGSFERISSFFKHFFAIKNNENTYKVNMTLNRNKNAGYYYSEIDFLSHYMIKLLPNLKIIQIDDSNEEYIKNIHFYTEENVKKYFLNNDNFKSNALFVLQNGEVKKYSKN